MRKILLCMFILCSSCELSSSPKEEEDSRKEGIQITINSLEKYSAYYKDKTNNICFIGSGVGYNAGVLATVPCTPEIEKVANVFTSNPMRIK